VKWEVTLNTELSYFSYVPSLREYPLSQNCPLCFMCISLSDCHKITQKSQCKYIKGKFNQIVSHLNSRTEISYILMVRYEIGQKKIDSSMIHLCMQWSEYILPKFILKPKHNCEGFRGQIFWTVIKSWKLHIHNKVEWSYLAPSTMWRQSTFYSVESKLLRGTKSSDASLLKFLVSKLLNNTFLSLINYPKVFLL
jgi:hypothetical protein